jgi:hypothetical protein
VPNRFRFVIFNSDDAQEAKPTLELKDQIIARRELRLHESKISACESEAQMLRERGDAVATVDKRQCGRND